MFTTINGTNRSDNLAGTDGDNIIYGNGGSDYIRAGAGNDYIIGNAGNDVMWGGNGADIFVFSANDGRQRDTIRDFSDGDLINIFPFHVTADDVTIAHQGKRAVVTIEGTDTKIVVLGQAAHDLDISDFILS